MFDKVRLYKINGYDKVMMPSNQLYRIHFRYKKLLDKTRSKKGNSLVFSC